MLGVFPAFTETFVLRELAALRQRGLDITICAVRRPQAGLPPATPQVDATCLYARPDHILRHAVANLSCLLLQPSRYLGGLLTFMRAARALAPGEALQLMYHYFAGIGFGRDLQRRGVTHIHCHFTSATNMALAAHMVCGTAFSFTAHASADLFVRPLLLDEKLAHARFAVAVCDYSQRFLDSITGFRHSRKVHRIYNGVASLDTERRAAAAERRLERSSSSSRLRRVVSVGSLVAAKGHATLIQVCGKLHAQGQCFTCRIVGEGPERPTLERLILENRLQKCVELVGALTLDAVHEELLQGDVFVLLTEIGPSGYRDGFPTAILEAMAAGLPVLATALSGIPEMVVDGVTGRLVREREVDAATEALRSLLDSPELRQNMGRAGQKRVQELFEVAQSADQLAALLAESCGPRFQETSDCLDPSLTG